MSKKKKSKSLKKALRNNDYGWNSKKKKKNQPKTKRIEATIPEKQARKNRRIVTKPVDVAKEILEARTVCNHHGDIISVAKFKEICAGWTAYIPDLDSLVARYGEEHVHVCASCFDAVVDRDMVSPDDVSDAIATLVSASVIAVSNEKLSKKEIRKINETRANLNAFRPVWRILKKLEEEEESKSASGGRSDSNTSSLNNNDSIFVG